MGRRVRTQITKLTECKTYLIGDRHFRFAGYIGLDTLYIQRSEQTKDAAPDYP